MKTLSRVFIFFIALNLALTAAFAEEIVTVPTGTGQTSGACTARSDRNTKGGEEKFGGVKKENGKKAGQTENVTEE